MAKRPRSYSSSANRGSIYNSRASKRLRFSGGYAGSRKKATFASRVKSLVLKNSETKIANQEFQLNVTNNVFHGTDAGLHGGVGTDKLISSQNLIGTVPGTGPHQRIGEQIHFMFVCIKGSIFKSPQADQFGLSKENYYRIVVVEMNREQAEGLTTTAPTDFVADQNLFITSYESAMTNYINRKYRVVYDHTHSHNDPFVNEPEDAIADAWPIQASTFRFDIKIPINKTLSYKESNYKPSKVYCLYIAGQNIPLSNDSQMAIARCQIFHHFKDS